MAQLWNTTSERDYTDHTNASLQVCEFGQLLIAIQMAAQVDTYDQHIYNFTHTDTDKIGFYPRPADSIGHYVCRSVGPQFFCRKFLSFGT